MTGLNSGYKEEDTAYSKIRLLFTASALQLRPVVAPCATRSNGTAQVTAIGRLGYPSEYEHSRSPTLAVHYTPPPFCLLFLIFSISSFMRSSHFLGLSNTSSSTTRFGSALGHFLRLFLCFTCRRKRAPYVHSCVTPLLDPYRTKDSSPTVQCTRAATTC